MKIRFTLLALSLFASIAQAQFPEPFEFVLIPVYATEPVPGVAGSRFVTHFSMVNAGSQRVTVEGFDPLCMTLCPPDAHQVRPGHTYIDPPLDSRISARDALNGLFILVLRRYSSEVKFNLRAQDISRQGSTYGTEIPVIRERDALQSRAELHPIPVSREFRVMLRMYDFVPQQVSQLSLRIFKIDAARRGLIAPAADELLLERTIQLAPSTSTTWAHPGYAELPNLTALAQGAEYVRVELEPITPGLRYWAFATVTHNETQHITVVTPN